MIKVDDTGWEVRVDGTRSVLADLGAVPVRYVSQIEYTGQAFAQVARDLHAGAEGFIRNAATSPEAPVAAEVLAPLARVVEAAQAAQRAAMEFLQRFAAYYDEDIHEAHRAARMNNQALTG
jgi:hypothetical protein